MGNCGCNDGGALSMLEDRLSDIEGAMAPFLSGHPIMPLTEASDIAAFDTTTGWGSGIWSAWAIADGRPYTRNGVTVQTYDLRDRFIVGGGTSYAVNDTGGEATVTLTEAELPAVSLSITDPGHTHTVTDPGHTHTLTDPGHTHAASQNAHTHTFTTESDGLHTHALTSGADIVSSNNGSLFLDGVSGAAEVSDTDSLVANGEHTHTGVTDSQTPAVTVTSAFTGASVQSNTTGITGANSNTTGISVSSFGSGEAHNNLPPYHAVLFVQRIA